MSPVENYQVYNSAMARSMYDKLFWVDKVKKPDCIVDFGCADGTMIEASKICFPNARYIGVDTVPQTMVTNCEVVTKFEELSDLPENTLLILSSVIHEVYSYADVNNFWTNIVPFQQIVVRDMAVRESIYNSYVGVDLNRSKLYSTYPEQVKDFEKVWCKIQNRQQLMHFLLKYKYTENWKREVQENYLPLSVQDLTKKFLYSHGIAYESHTPLQYLQEMWNKDFGIWFNAPTHAKLIFERN